MLVIWDRASSELALWDLAARQRLGNLVGLASSLESVEFTKNGRRLITTHADHTLGLWDVRTRRSLGAFVLGDRRMAWSSDDGERIVTCSHNRVETWKPLSSEKALSSVTLYPVADRNCSRVSADGKLLITYRWDSREIEVWDVESGQRLCEPLFQVNLQNELIGKTRQLLTFNVNRPVQVWDLTTGRAQSGFPIVPRSIEAKFSPTARYLATRGKDGAALGIWDVETGSLKAWIPVVHSAQDFVGFDFSSDVRLVVWVGSYPIEHCTIRVWDIEKGEPVGRSIESNFFSRPGPYPRLSPHGSLAFLRRKTALEVLDLEKGTPVGPHLQHNTAISDFVFGATGDRIVTTAERTARIWNTVSGEEIATLQHGDYLSAAQLSPDGRRLVTGTSSGGFPRVWDTDSGRPLPSGDWPIGNVDLLQFDREGSHLLLCNGVSCVVGNPDGKSMGVPIRLHEAGRPIQLSPDGLRVAIASSNEVKLWDARTALELASFPIERVHDMRFSSDGQQLWVAGDSQVRILDIPLVPEGDAPLLARLAEAVSGYRLGDNGELLILLDQISHLTRLRQETADAPLGRPTAASLTRWFLADRHTRTISPLSSTTVTDFIRRHLQEGTSESLSEVLHGYPDHPLLADVPRLPVEPSPTNAYTP